MRIALATVVLMGALLGALVPHGGSNLPAPAPAATVAPRETVVARDPRGHFVTYADVNGTATRFVVDTGADVVALTEEDARRAHVGFDPARYRVVGQGASGAVRGMAVMIETIDMEGKHAGPVAGVVVADLPVSLLGQSYLRQLRGVAIEGDVMRLR